MSNSEIGINDLQQADILVFSGVKGNILSEAIMLLTDSTVSHAAMSYTTPEKIIEEVGKGACISPALPEFKDRTIYVNRRNAMPPATPVLAAAKGYVDNDTPYAFGNLILVGLILIYKKITPSSFMQRVMIKIYKKLAYEIIKWVNQRAYPGKLPMFCSQFVCQCYEDAGTDYVLAIKDGTIVGKSLFDEQAQWSLLDYAILKSKTDKSEDFMSLLSSDLTTQIETLEELSEETLGAELMEALGSAENEEKSEFSYELVAAAYQFAEALYMAQTGADTLDLTTLASASEKSLSPDSLNFLKVEESYFVTPADLLDKITNATRIGHIKIK